MTCRRLDPIVSAPDPLQPRELEELYRVRMLDADVMQTHKEVQSVSTRLDTGIDATRTNEMGPTRGALSPTVRMTIVTTTSSIEYRNSQQVPPFVTLSLPDGRVSTATRYGYG